jgi:hypothetical protein
MPFCLFQGDQVLERLFGPEIGIGGNKTRLEGFDSRHHRTLVLNALAAVDETQAPFPCQRLGHPFPAD